MAENAVELQKALSTYQLGDRRGGSARNRDALIRETQVGAREATHELISTMSPGGRKESERI